MTTVEALGQHYLPAILAQFQGQNPGVAIELILSNQALNLSRRDADVAIRLTNHPPETLVGRRICVVRWAMYCRRDLVAALGPRTIDSVPFIGFAENFGPTSGRRWIETQIPPGRLAARVNSVHSMLELTIHGFGAALLPCFLGDPCSTLVRVGQPLGDVDLGLWILTHSDLRRSARVRAFMDFTSVELAKHRRTIEGAENEDSSGLARLATPPVSSRP